MNKKIVAITSMNKDYYDSRGRSMLKSFVHNWSIPMYVYNEDSFQVKVKGVNPMGWNLGPEYVLFQKAQTNDRVRTFGKKAFSIIHAMKFIECDRLIWLDADTICTFPMPELLFDFIAPDDVLSTHLGVRHTKEGKDWFSCETGFFILNKQHEMFPEFKKHYMDMYIAGRYLNEIRRYYDGEVYGHTVKTLESKGAKMFELNPEQRHKTPMPRSLVGPYITHFKGKSLKLSAGSNSDIEEKYHIEEDD